VLSHMVSSLRTGSSQARILIKGKVTHLGYYGTEEEVRRVQMQLHGGISCMHCQYHRLESVCYIILSLTMLPQAARIYDRVCLSLHGPNSGLNFPADEYKHLPAVVRAHARAACKAQRL
jgi:hypothetical protein